MSLPSLLAAVLAVLALAVTATSASAQTPVRNLPLPTDPAFLVPPGKVEHTVTIVKVEGSRAIPRHERQERWMTRTRARTVVTDVATGKVLRELTYAPGESRVYDAEEGRVTIIKERGLSRPPWTTFAFEAAVQKAYIEQGITRVIGETTVNGRRALQVESVPGKWKSDEPNGRTTATVDAETYVLYARQTAHPNGAFTQTDTHEVSELLDSGSVATARMAMGKHKGAKVKRVGRK